MVKRITVTSVLMGLAALAVLLGVGCGPSTELTGLPIPNTLPDTRVTARPPDVLEAGFVVQFYWSGNDADGRIDHYQWKISNNGTDGISVQDTLTFDPVTGDTLNPWFDIVSSDSTFLVTADIPEFPGDPDNYHRSYQTHTFWVRAVDEDGGIDPTPALVSFTSTTLLPTVNITGPINVVNQGEAAQLPSTVTFLFDGEDRDFSSGLPTRVRYLWKKALLPDSTYADTPNDFRNNLEYLVAFDDSAWSEWRTYDTNDETRRITKEDQPQTEADPFNPGQQRNIFYAFAVQVQDTAGAVSIGRTYGTQVANVRITQSLSPQLRILERFLGQFTGAGPNQQSSLDIAAGQELNFSWVADASGYAGEVVSYRYGWDVTDVNDPNDPNWALLPGNSVQHRRSPPISFASGVHTLTVEVVDNSNQVSRRVITLDVVPVPDPGSQLPMLFIDDIPDRNSNAWVGEDGTARDNDVYRDQFWTQTLVKVAGFNPASHIIDTEADQIEYRDVVQFRTLVWSSKWVSLSSNAVARDFRPGLNNAVEVDKYIWLQPYQESVGNVLFAGSRAMNSFLAESPYELPIVFESREGDENGISDVEGVTVKRGFGERELPDGSIIQVGPTRYPYATMGVATLDIMSPNATYYNYGTGRLANLMRRKACASMKGLRIDPDFKARYMPSGGVFPDIIWSDQVIDWYDTWGPWYTDTDYPGDGGDHEEYEDPLGYPYVWQNDEFYDADVIGRNTNFSLQMCGEDSVRCVEAMFRSISRYNWVRENMIAEGNLDWPEGFYGGQGQGQLDDLCGNVALSLDRERAITTNQIVGFIARKTAPNKPSQVGDVLFGFDPYRFDNEEIKKVVHWVLGEHFGLGLNP